MKRTLSYLILSYLILLAPFGCKKKANPVNSTTPTSTTDTSANQTAKVSMMLKFPPNKTSSEACYYGVTRSVDFNKANKSLQNSTTARLYVANLFKSSTNVTPKSVNSSSFKTFLTNRGQTQSLNLVDGGTPYPYSTRSDNALYNEMADVFDNVAATPASLLAVGTGVAMGAPALVAAGLAVPYMKFANEVAETSWEVATMHANANADAQDAIDAAAEQQKTADFNEMLATKRAERENAATEQSPEIDLEQVDGSPNTGDQISFNPDSWSEDSQFVAYNNDDSEAEEEVSASLTSGTSSKNKSTVTADTMKTFVKVLGDYSKQNSGQTCPSGQAISSAMR